MSKLQDIKSFNKFKKAALDTFQQIREETGRHPSTEEFCHLLNSHFDRDIISINQLYSIGYSGREQINEKFATDLAGFLTEGMVPWNYLPSKLDLAQGLVGSAAPVITSSLIDTDTLTRAFSRTEPGTLSDFAAQTAKDSLMFYYGDKLGRAYWNKNIQPSLIKKYGRGSGPPNNPHYAFYEPSASGAAGAALYSNLLSGLGFQGNAWRDIPAHLAASTLGDFHGRKLGNWAENRYGGRAASLARTAEGKAADFIRDYIPGGKSITEPPVTKTSRATLKGNWGKWALPATIAALVFGSKAAFGDTPPETEVPQQPKQPEVEETPGFWPWSDPEVRLVQPKTVNESIVFKILHNKYRNLHEGGLRGRIHPEIRPEGHPNIHGGGGGAEANPRVGAEGRYQAVDLPGAIGRFWAKMLGREAAYNLEKALGSEVAGLVNTGKKVLVRGEGPIGQGSHVVSPESVFGKGSEIPHDIRVVDMEEIQKAARATTPHDHQVSSDTPSGIESRSFTDTPPSSHHGDEDPITSVLDEPVPQGEDWWNFFQQRWGGGRKNKTTTDSAIGSRTGTEKGTTDKAKNNDRGGGKGEKPHEEAKAKEEPKAKTTMLGRSDSFVIPGEQYGPFEGPPNEILSANVAKAFLGRDFQGNFYYQPGTQATRGRGLMESEDLNENKLSPSESAKRKSDKQKYRVVYMQDGKKVEVFASSIRGVRRVVHGKAQFRIYDSKGADVTGYFKRLMNEK